MPFLPMVLSASKSKGTALRGSLARTRSLHTCGRSRPQRARTTPSSSTLTACPGLCFEKTLPSDQGNVSRGRRQNHLSIRKSNNVVVATRAARRGATRHVTRAVPQERAVPDWGWQRGAPLACPLDRATRLGPRGGRALPWCPLKRKPLGTRRGETRNPTPAAPKPVAPTSPLRLTATCAAQKLAQTPSDKPKQEGQADRAG